MAKRKYHVPDAVAASIDTDTYEKWLHRKAIAHVRRDRKRGNVSASVAQYKQAIHDTVANGGHQDYYTGELLDWKLVSTYDNAESKAGGRQYKAKFALLPTVDHVDDGLGEPNFVICGWRTNDAKNDMSREELIEFCERVLSHAKR